MGSAIPIAGWGFAAIDIARDGGAFEKTPLKSKKDEEKEEKKDENEVKKSKEPDKLNRVVDKFDSVVNKYSLKGKSFGVISKAKKWFGFSEGGKVPGSGNRDTVPAMLTPGEVVMSKPAVDKIGADNLLAANAAGGGTNKPKYTMGYGMGQILPDQYSYNRTEFTKKHTQKTRNGELVDSNTEEDFSEIQGSIGVPDLMEHQQQLVEELRKVEGYENVNIIDVMERMNDRGRLVSMPDKVLYPILNASDAYKATEAKRDAAAAEFWKKRDLVNPDGSVKGYSHFNENWNGGGLVQGLNGGGLVADTRTLGPNSPLPSPGWGRKGGFTPTPMWQKPSPSGGSGSWGTSIKLAKQNRPVGMVDDEVIVINTIPNQPTQQGGTPQIIPIPVGGESQPQSSPTMPSYFQIVNSIRISSLLTKLSIT